MTETKRAIKTLEIALEEPYGEIGRTKFYAVIEPAMQTGLVALRAQAEREDKSTPTADVAPVVRARWIDGRYYQGRTERLCIRCHEWSADRGKYCPNCGALMEGGEKG